MGRRSQSQAPKYGCFACYAEPGEFCKAGCRNMNRQFGVIGNPTKETDMKEVQKAITLRGMFASVGVVRIKMVPEAPSDDFEGPWDNLPQPVRDKWIALARWIERWSNLS